MPSPRPALFIFRLLAATLVALNTGAFTLDELRARQDLTPVKLASLFNDFEFQFRGKIQKPEAFLKSRSGDCDDYATFAAGILREKGYTTRLIAVRMPKVVHVICYVEEAGCYLDYNEHSPRVQVVRCGPEISAIASSVARGLNLNWSSASEFTYEAPTKRLVKTVVPPKTSVIAAITK